MTEEQKIAAEEIFNALKEILFVSHSQGIIYYPVHNVDRFLTILKNKVHYEE